MTRSFTGIFLKLEKVNFIEKVAENMIIDKVFFLKLFSLKQTNKNGTIWKSYFLVKHLAF